MTDRKDLDLFLKDAKIASLEKRITELENGTTYTALINEIGKLRAERDMYMSDANKLEAIRRVIE